MVNNFRPRRSVLYMPGSNARALEKAKTLPADSLILDLEDAVAPESKSQARQQLCEVVKQGGYGHREIIIRINALETDWGREDITAIAALPIDGVLIPKVNKPQEINEVAILLSENGANSELPLWIMAETPRCIANIEEIAGSHPRLTTIVMGTSDLAKEMRVRHTPDRVGLLFPLSACVIAARIHGLEILDGVYLNLSNDEGFHQACIQARDMGFDGKTLIHPKQIEAANQVFAPSETELAQAQKIISAWEEASQQGKGVVVLDGQLIENLHVEEAKRLLALNQVIAKMREV